MGLPQFLQGVPPQISGWRRIWVRMVLTEMPNMQAISAAERPCSRISLMALISCFFMGNTPFEYAILCVRPHARCPVHKPQRFPPPMGVFPQKLMRICAWNPTPVAHSAWAGDVYPPPPGTKRTERTVQLTSNMGLVRYTSEGRLPAPRAGSTGFGVM